MNVAPAASMTQADAAAVFARARTLCAADAGRLWGKSLCVPMMIVDSRTREAFVNVAIRGFVRDGALYRSSLPNDAAVSTAPFTYRGVRVAQITWPMFGGVDTQAVTLMHESFHIVQPTLGVRDDADNGGIAGDAALDTQRGRLWFRGELHALRSALQATGDARKRALEDALAMRSYRDALFPETVSSEREQDIVEGLAEGTGIDAGLPVSHRIPYACFDIAFVERQPSYARAFPYATGPAFTEFLDAANPSWRHVVSPSSDIAGLVMRAYGLSVRTPTASQARSIIARYDGAAIASEEEARARRNVRRRKNYVREFESGSVLTLPMAKFSITFDPREVEAFEPYGSIYHTLSITAPWGKIAVLHGDAMISKDFRSLRVGSPRGVDGNVPHGRGWRVTLAPHRAIVADPEKSGSYVLSDRRATMRRPRSS